MSPNERLAKRARLVRARAGETPSPCVSVCRMSSATELCLGCFRSLDEIALWGRMDEEAKRQVWRAIEKRLEQSALTTTRQERKEDA